MAEETKKGAAKAAAPISDDAVKALTEKVAALEAQNADLKSEADKVASLEKENELLKSELEDAAEVIEDLKAQVKNNGKSKGPTVTVGKQKYLVKAGYRTKDRIYTPEDIAADSKLAQGLLKKGSTLLKPID